MAGGQDNSSAVGSAWFRRMIFGIIVLIPIIGLAVIPSRYQVAFSFLEIIPLAIAVGARLRSHR